MEYTLYPLKYPNKTALVNLFTPCEIINAFGLYPQCAEGFSSYMTGGKCERGFLELAEEKGVPQTYCAYHKALLGGVFSGVLPKPRALVSTTSVCDANVLTFNKLHEVLGAPLFVIDIPYTADEKSVKYVEKQLLYMVEFLQKNTGGNFSEAKLKKAIENYNTGIFYRKKFFSELKNKYFPTSITLEMYKIIMTHILSGTDEAAEFFKMQYEEILGQEDFCGKRIIWSHVLPYFSPSLQSMFDFKKNFQLLLCDMNIDYMEEIDENDMFYGMARRLVYNKFNGDNKRKTDMIIKAAKYFNADGAVIFSHWGCKQSSGGIDMLKKALDGENIKNLILSGDACDTRNAGEEQIKTRIEAFGEMLGGGL